MVVTMLLASVKVMNEGKVDLKLVDEPVHNIKAVGDTLKNYGFKDTWIPWDQMKKEYTKKVIEGTMEYIVSCYYTQSLFGNKYGR